MSERLARFWPWWAGLATGLAVVGPGLRPGSLLSLDLVATPTIPVPSGIWGLGPDLPRRVPYGAALAWLSHVTGGPPAMKLVMVGAIASAFAGAVRLVGDQPWPARAGAGLLYAVSPFTLTRIGAGHVGVVLAMAVLPWALPSLLQPAGERRRALLWATALGLTGFAGGTLALLVLAVGACADRGRRLLSTVGVAVVSQLPWVAPSLVIAATSGTVQPAAGFATRLGGPWGALQLVSGHGFWRAGSQVGPTTAATALVGGAVIVLAVIGARRLPSAWGRRATSVAVLGLAMAAASGIPGIATLYRDATGFGPGVVLRESQRVLPLFLVWAAPAAALGAVELARELRQRWSWAYLVVPAACAVVLAAPGLWGIGGRLEPVQFPGGWAPVRAEVRARPGPVLALPWHEYLDLDFADGRRVLNPLPDYLGGDVLSSADPELGSGGQERVDERQPGVLEALADLRAGRPAAAALARLGVRWVVLAHEVDWDAYRSVASDPGLERAVGTSTIDLYAVRAWTPTTGPRPPSKGWPTVVVLLADLVAIIACLRARGSCEVTDGDVPSLSAVNRR